LFEQGMVAFLDVPVPPVDVPITPRPRPLSFTSAPNPARSRADFQFALPVAGAVTLAVYDAAGRRVAKLLDQQPLEAGPHLVPFRTGAMKAGVYFAHLEFGAQRATRKVMVVK
jgi:hypothetical protein